MSTRGQEWHANGCEKVGVREGVDLSREASGVLGLDARLVRGGERLDVGKRGGQRLAGAHLQPTQPTPVPV